MAQAAEVQAALPVRWYYGWGPHASSHVTISDWDAGITAAELQLFDKSFLLLLYFAKGEENREEERAFRRKKSLSEEASALEFPKPLLI